MKTIAHGPAFMVDEKGYYGRFGGAYIPEILHRNVKQLSDAFAHYVDDRDFNRELDILLSDYVGRPSPLYRAARLSERYGAEIYLKREDLNHTGAHKINNAIGSVLLARRMDKNILSPRREPDSMASRPLQCVRLWGWTVQSSWGATDVMRQQPNVQRMQMLGARVVAVDSGNKTLKDATNEAIRYWCCHPDSFYVIGSTVGPDPYPRMVAHFQSVISREMKAQLLEHTGREFPDAVVACVGGGSNAAGAFYHFIDNQDVRLIAAEAAGMGVDTDMTAATISVGTEGIIHGARTMVMQTPDGQIVEPYSISAGLDYPGIGPLHAHLADCGREEVVAITDREALDAAMLLTRTEGIIPALESAHALAALERIRFESGQTIVVNLSGRGDKDMHTYLSNLPSDFGR